MANKPALTITDQIKLLKSRGMLFRDETMAAHYLKNISYYRLKGYWWDMQADKLNTYSTPIHISKMLLKDMTLIVFCVSFFLMR
jgi:abortive infection bacteriophage resistance protein